MPDPDAALADLYEQARKQGVRILVLTGLSPAEAQTRLRERGIERSLSQIRRMCASKTLQATKTKDGWRIESDSLNAWPPDLAPRLDRERFHLLTERQRQAAELYLDGGEWLTYGEIGEALGGISRQGVASLLRTAINRLKRTT